MREAPHAKDLLDSAMETLRRDIIPALGPEHRYTVLMINRALAIAKAEATSGEKSDEDEVAELAAFLNVPDSQQQASPADRLDILNRQFALLIRQGVFDFDEGSRKQAHRVLSGMVARRQAISQPGS